MTRRERAAKLRGQLAAADRSGAGKPFPAQLRHAVVDYAAEAKVDGDTMEAAARELGISAMSIKRWTERLGRQPEGGPGLRRVEIVAEPTRTELVPPAPSLVVHTPSGLRIEGLTLPTLAALVRAVG